MRADPSVICQHAYDGKLFPVRLSRDVVQGRQAYPAAGARPERAALVILIVPPMPLLSRSQAGVKTVLVLASGFAEEPGTVGGS